MAKTKKEATAQEAVTPEFDANVFAAWAPVSIADATTIIASHLDVPTVEGQDNDIIHSFNLADAYGAVCQASGIPLEAAAKVNEMNGIFDQGTVTANINYLEANKPAITGEGNQASITVKMDFGPAYGNDTNTTAKMSVYKGDEENLQARIGIVMQTNYGQACDNAIADLISKL